jgi:hypothetical protein
VRRVTTNSTCGSRDVDEVLLGVDTHLDFHVAVVLDILGRRLGEWHFHPGGPPEASLTDVRGVVVVGVALEGENRGGVPGEGLEVPDGLAALSEQAKARVP